MSNVICVSQNKDKRLEVFYIGTNDIIYHNWQKAPNGGVSFDDWHGEEKFKDVSHYYTAKQICVGQNQDGRLEIFYIGTNDIIYHNWQKAPNGGVSFDDWHGEEEFKDGSSYLHAKQICVGQNQDGRLEIFYIGTDDRLYHIWQNAPNGGVSFDDWNGKKEFKDGSHYYTAKQICVGQNQDGRLEIFYIGTNDRLYHNWQKAPNSGVSFDDWHGEEEFKDGSHYYTAKQICVGQNKDGRLEIFYIGTNDRLYHNWQKAPNSGWIGEGEFKDGSHYYTAKQICVGQNKDGRLEIFYTGMNDIIYHNWQKAPNSGWIGEEEFKDGSHYYTAKQICVGQNKDGRLEIFYTGMNDIIYHNWQKAPNGGVSFDDWHGEEEFKDGSSYLHAKQICVGQNKDGRLEIFYTGMNDIIYHNWQKGSGGWIGEEEFKDGSSYLHAKQIYMGQNKDGRLEIFYTGMNDIIYHNWQKAPNGGVSFDDWHGKEEFKDGSSYLHVKQICVGQNQDGRLEIFYIGTDDRLYHNWQKAPNGGVSFDDWHGKEEFKDGSHYYTAKQICVGQNKDGRLEIFYIGTNDRLYHNWQKAPNGGVSFDDWHGEEEFKDRSHYYTAKQICVGQNQDGRLEIFYIGTNDRLYHNWQMVSDVWRGEEEFKHGSHYYTAKQICVGQNQDGRLEIFYIGTNDRLYHNWQEIPNTYFWSGEEEFKDVSHYYTAKQICVGQNQDGRLEIFYIGTNGGFYHNWQKAPNGGWNGEKQLVHIYTVCFCGTSCTRDEGEETRPSSSGFSGSDKRIYCDETGYIPVRIHKEISGSLKATSPSITVRGVAENDWSIPRDNSEDLKLDGPLLADGSLFFDVLGVHGDQRSTSLWTGWSAPALALHGANLAAASGAQQYNFIGHSRGAVECIMAAWFLYAYGSQKIRDTPVNIFAIDPVPGTGEWYGIFTQLPPNVVNYVGVYAWDMCVQPGDYPFMALVPRPNGRMTGKNNHVTLKGSEWKYIADDAQLTDPLAPGNFPQPTGYELYACRGRHSTVAGNTTADSQYNQKNLSRSVEPVPQLIYKIARAYLTKWETIFPVKSAVAESALELRKKINTDHRKFDTMGGGETRSSIFPDRPYVRRVSSIYGRNPANVYYMDDVVGNPPYKMAYPVTKDRKNTGWVKWKFL